MAAPRSSAVEIIALGFGTTVGIWAAAYILHLPAVDAPAWLLTGVFALGLLTGGYLTGRYTRRGWVGGALVGALSGLLNLLILGSAVGGGDSDAMRALPLFALASLALSAVLGLLGAAVGTTRRARSAATPDWVNALTRVQAAVVFLLLIAGGLVTSNRAGMAVPDWPSSFGYNMFLLPLSHMGDKQVFLEHAHRLLGSLVGITALTTALTLTFARDLHLRAPKVLAWAILVAVALQGVLGGVRVVENEAVVGLVHGIIAQLIFAACVALVVLTTPRWRAEARVKSSPSASIDRIAPVALAGLLVLQITLGADIRHLQNEGLLMAHITVALLALVLAIVVGARAWGLYPDVPLVKRGGTGVMHLAIMQVVLGILTVVAGAYRVHAPAEPSFIQALASTVHQANGALLLAFTVRLALWSRRLLSTDAQEPAEAQQAKAAS